MKRDMLSVIMHFQKAFHTMAHWWVYQDTHGACEYALLVKVTPTFHMSQFQ